MERKCPKQGCTRRIPPDRFACRDHWFLIPPDVRDLINHTWRRRLARGTKKDIDAHEAAKRAGERALNGEGNGGSDEKTHDGAAT